MKNECCGYRYTRILLYLLLAAVVSLSGCTDPETAKAEHLKRGETTLKSFVTRKPPSSFATLSRSMSVRARRTGDSPAPTKDYSAFRR